MPASVFVSGFRVHGLIHGHEYAHGAHANDVDVDTLMLMFMLMLILIIAGHKIVKALKR
jgi:hypothetical protein